MAKQHSQLQLRAFNSTRYIRNIWYFRVKLFGMSTFNSTRYIRNRYYRDSSYHVFKAFNSTRYIRNQIPQPPECAETQ